MALSGLLLMGGQNTRMNGTRKAFLSYRGRPFYRHLAESMAGLEQLYLSVEAAGLYPGIPYRQIIDQYPRIGPLGGIASALSETGAAALLVLPCDMPGITRGFVDYLRDWWQRYHEPFIISHGERLQPLVGVYTQACLPVISQMIAAEEYRLRTLIRQMKFKIISVDDIDGAGQMLVNVNTPEDFQQLKSFIFRQDLL